MLSALRGHRSQPPNHTLRSPPGIRSLGTITANKQQTVQCGAVYCSTAEYITVQYSTVQEQNTGRAIDCCCIPSVRARAAASSCLPCLHSANKPCVRCVCGCLTPKILLHPSLLSTLPSTPPRRTASTAHHGRRSLRCLRGWPSHQEHQCHQGQKDQKARRERPTQAVQRLRLRQC